MNRSIGALLVASMLVSACGNTVYGPRRLIQAGEIDDGKNGERACPTVFDRAAAPSPIDLSEYFSDLACASLRSPRDIQKARELIDHGVLLNRLRCNDFFAQRAANQMRQRVIRSSVIPISALLTGVIGVTSFSSDAEQQEAIQILALGQNATTAGLELYESEFLFGADNINAVRTLTMRALDEHAALILSEDVGFYAAARHLIDHQMICTPANILDLTQVAIRQGRIEPARTTTVETLAAADGDRAVIGVIARNLRVTDLTGDQVGALWWLSELIANGSPISQDALAVINAKLSDLPVRPISEVQGVLQVDTELMRSFRPLIQSLSPSVTSGFEVVKRLLLAEIQKSAQEPIVDRARNIVFELPPSESAPISRAQEIRVSPASSR